jgi:phosphate starvation-inducible membrane PsiE
VFVFFGHQIFSKFEMKFSSGPNAVGVVITYHLYHCLGLSSVSYPLLFQTVAQVCQSTVEEVIDDLTFRAGLDVFLLVANGFRVWRPYKYIHDIIFFFWLILSFFALVVHPHAQFTRHMLLRFSATMRQLARARVQRLTAAGGNQSERVHAGSDGIDLMDPNVLTKEDVEQWSRQDSADAYVSLKASSTLEF